MSESQQKTEKPIIGISIGDYNGIGPEVTMKALNDPRILRHFTPLIYADGKIISYYRKALDLQQFAFHQVRQPEEVQHRKINLIQLGEKELEVTPGKGTPESGLYAVESLSRAVADLKAQKIHALVTAPLSKDLIQSDTFKFPGHTEYLTKEAEAPDSLMLLIAEELRVAVVTGHIPLKEVSNQLTRERVSSKLNLLLQSLKKDFGIKKPRVAVLGLNPHAGENGLLGEEDQRIILPVIQTFKDKGNLVFGPFPADGLFGSGQFASFHGILAMYHDQGLVPFKTIAFDTGVNFTAGLSFVRTSPDHGTAFDLAGKGTASETSMRRALYAAADILANRATS